jgi:CSLREA domain-containing protein
MLLPECYTGAQWNLLSNLRPATESKSAGSSERSMPSMMVDTTMWVQRAKVLALYVLVVLVVASIGVLLEAKPAHAKTFTVNSTGDALDASPPNGICDVDPRVFVSQCTLREALPRTRGLTP